MINSILNERRYEIQTRFSVLDHLYHTGELTVIPFFNQESYRSSFVEIPTKLISLHLVAAKIGTSNKVAVHCSYKKICTLQSRCKSRKSGFIAPNIVTILAVTMEMQGLYKKIRKPWFCLKAKMIVK